MEVYRVLVCLHAVVPEKVCGIRRCAAFSHPNGSCPFEWCDRNKDIPRAVSFVFMIKTAGVSTRRLPSAMSRISVVCRQSYAQIQDLLKQTYEFDISQGEIAKILEKEGNRMRPEYERLKAKIRGEPSVHLNEHVHLLGRRNELESLRRRRLPPIRLDDGRRRER